MTPQVESFPVDRRPLRHALALAFAVLVWLSAGGLWYLQDTLGPGQQRVNVRFAEDVSVEARRTFEQQHGLLAGEARAERTWIYQLTDQSPGNIGALLESPLVEDTAHIDRTRRRVVLDQPGLPLLVRELLEREWLPYGSWLLALVGVVLVWSARGSVAETPRVLRVIGGRAEALTGRQEAMLHLGLCALFLTPILMYGPTDDEELALGMFSSQIYYRDLLHGRWSYWFSDLGFGTPMPLGHRLDFHPVFALASLISLRAAVSGVWIVHVGVMAVYFRRLLAAYGLTPSMRLAFFALYLFSFPSLLLFYATDWVSCLVPWTLYPVLLYYVRDAVMGAAATRWWLTTVRLGVLFSLWVLNAHPGYLVPLFVVLAAYTLAAAPPTLPVYGALGTAGMFAVAASAERIYFLVHEKGLFPAEILRLTQDDYHLLEYLVSLAPPLTRLSDLRQPFVGAFVFGAAVAAPIVWRTVDRHIRGCIIAFFVAVAMSMTPVQYLAWTGLSGGWLFRDPMVFFGLLSAAAIAQSALAAPRRRFGQIALGLLALQGVQQLIVISPDLRAHWRGAARLEWYRHQGRPFGVGAAVIRASSLYGRRLYLSPGASDLSRGSMSRAGVHAVTDYALLGLNPVNAWFKNVAMDRIHPSWVLMHGIIRGQRSVIENATLLDVLGINVVVAMTDEGLAPKGLIRLERVRVDSEFEVEIFANPDAWPEAVLLSPNASAAALPLLERCDHDAALCRDYTALAHTRLQEDVALREDGDGYRVHVPPSDAPRLLFVSAFYRPEWVATAADERLPIEPIANAFIGVTVPPGIQDIELAFRPRTRIALTWLSAVSLVALLAALGTLAWRRRAASAGQESGGVASRRMAIDAPTQSWVDRHQQIWREKAVLRAYYEREYFRRLVAEMPQGRSLELGAGPGFFSAYKRCDVVTDITPAPHVDRVVDVHEMPFEPASFDCVVGLDVVHHFARPSQAFTEVARVLRPGGRLVLIEPWTGFLGYLFCRYIHHEDCFSIAEPWGPVFPEGKDPMAGNATIPKTYFFDRATELEDRTGLRVVKIETFSFFGYVATGGFTRFALPKPLADMLSAVERWPPPWFWRHCAIKALIVAEKI